MLSRVDRREMEREEQKRLKKFTKWLMKMNKDQREFLEEYCKEASKNDILAFGQAFERVLRVKFQELFGNEFEAEALLEMIIDEVEIEGKALRNFENGSVEYMANIKKERENIIEIYTGLINNGINDKEAFEELKSAYPMFTASSIKNVIAEYKRDKKKSERKSEETVEIDANMNTEEIAAAILGTTDKENKAHIGEKEVKGKIIRQEEEKPTEEAIGKQNKEIKSKLVEVTKIREFVGQYGSYQKLQDGTIQTGDLTFSNANDIEECKSQIDRDLEAEKEAFLKRQEESRIKALGKLDEVAELLLM